MTEKVTQDGITQDVKLIVEEMLQQKEEVAMRKEIEKALTKSADKISELTASLEAKDNEISDWELKVEELESAVADLSDKVKELETDKQNLEKEKSDFEAEKEELVKQAEEVRTELENIKKDQLAQARFEDLKEAGVEATSGKAVEDQIAKIREMDDEAFEIYKEERVELRKSIIAKLEESSTEEAGAEEGQVDSSESEEEASQEDAETNSEEEEEETASEDEEDAADSTQSIEPMKAVAAMLNMEITPSKSMRAKYKELGEELAKRFKKGE